MGMTVQKDKGIHLPDCGLWLDPGRRKPLAAVTHAHSDHAAWHEETLLTPATSALMRARMSRPSGKIRELAFNQPHLFGGNRLTLLPAGHILGSAQVLVECETETLLYTGDFKLRAGLTSEAAIAVRADTLIMETTFGRRNYQFPPAAEVIQNITQFCEDAITDQHVPVLLAYSLGKAQELIASLAGTDLPIALHPAVAKMTTVYQEFGTRFPDWELFNAEDVIGKVVICPPNARQLFAQIPRIREAFISGWALDGRAKYQFKCHSAFPLSDHADYNDLLSYVEQVAPQRVFTVHGFTEDFARDLRRRGIEAWALGGVNQLELSLR